MLSSEKWGGTIAIGAFTVALGVMSLQSMPATAMELHRFGDLRAAQSTDPDIKGKSDPNTGRPANQPGNQSDPKPLSGGQAPSPTMQNAPQSGVPARCASVTDAVDRQKCMDTPKGQ